MSEVYEVYSPLLKAYPIVEEMFLDVLDDIYNEINRAIVKHGIDETPLTPTVSGTAAFIILAEEVGEVARALTRDEGDVLDYEKELIEVAAMATAAVVGSRRRRRNSVL